MRSATTGGRPPPSATRVEPASAARLAYQPQDDNLAQRIEVGVPHPHAVARARALNERRVEDDCRTLGALIADEVIPRLMLAHRRFALEVSGGMDGAEGIGTSGVESFAALLVAPDPRAAVGRVDALLDGGSDFEDLLVGLLEPAARHLGRMWETDTCCFSDVTIGLLRLQDMLRTLAARFEHSRRPVRAHMRVVLAALPGEHHVFGVRMVAEYFLRAGWLVNDDLQPSQASLEAQVAGQWCGLVGLSLSSELHVARLGALVRRLRDVSCNRHIGIMVGGNLFNEHPELVATVGADFRAVDGATAVAVAERWCGAAVVI